MAITIELTEAERESVALGLLLARELDRTNTIPDHLVEQWAHLPVVSVSRLAEKLGVAEEYERLLPIRSQFKVRISGESK